MPVEIQYIAWTSALALVHIIVAAHLQARQRGYLWAAGAREAAVAPLTGWANSAVRSLANFLETLPVFFGLALAVNVTGTDGWLVEYGVALYFWGRVVYAFLYRVPVVRSMIWNVSAVGLIFLIVALLK